MGSCWGIHWWSQLQIPQSSPVGSQWQSAFRGAGRARSQHKGSPESRATPRPCQTTQHDLPRSLSAAQIHLRPTMAKKLICLSSRAEGAPTALVLGKQQANRPQQLTVLPALFCRKGNFQGDALKNTYPPPLNHHKTHVLGSFNSNQDTLTTATSRTHTSPGQRPPLPSHHSDHRCTGAILQFGTKRSCRHPSTPS